MLRLLKRNCAAILKKMMVKIAASKVVSRDEASSLFAEYNQHIAPISLLQINTLMQLR